MTWTDLILRMILCLLIAGVIGAIIGWLLRSLFGGNKTNELEESWRSQLAGKDRELKTLRADGRKQIAAVEGQLADCNSGVKTHLQVIADHEAKYADLQASFNAKTMEYDKLAAELPALKDKLAMADSASAELHGKLATAEASLTSKHSELGDLTTKLAAATALAATLKERGGEAEKLRAENDLLRKRIGGLEAEAAANVNDWEARFLALSGERDGLQKQLGDVQSRLTTSEASLSSKDSEIGDLALKLAAGAVLATQLQNRDGEITSLKAEVDSLRAQLGNLQASNQSQTEDWEMKALQLSGDKDREIQELQKRVGELEPQAKDWEVKYLAVLDEKQKESLRVAELEPLGLQLASVQAAAQTKDSQISTLEARIQELENGRAAAEPVADLIRIQGIGPVYFGKLSSLSGLTMQADLLERGKTAVGRREIAAQTGIEESLILRWVNHCDLRRINGVDEQYAELLEVAGVDTVVELATRNPDNLFAKVVATNEEKRVAPSTPTAEDIRQWVEQAKTLPRVVTH